MLGKTGIYIPAAINTGVYCTLQAGPMNFAPGVPYNPTNAFSRLIFYGYSNASAAAGQIQPQILNGDGTYRDYGPLISTGGQGFTIGIIVTGIILGAQFNIVTAFSAGSAFLEIIGEIR